MFMSPDLPYARLRPSSSYEDILHPEDASVFLANPQPILTMFECLSETAQYTRVRRTSFEMPFRVLTKILLLVPTPKFGLGQSVFYPVEDSLQPLTVYLLEWHVKGKHEVYQVILNDKFSSRRYLPDELSTK
jgi:hypothetical protein